MGARPSGPAGNRKSVGKRPTFVKTLRILLLTFAAAAALVGCANGATSVRARSAGSSSTRSPSSTKPLSTTMSPSSTTLTTAGRGAQTGGSATVVQLTAADQGTVTVRVGEMVELTLDSTGLKWSSVMVTPTGLLQTDPAPTPPPHGQLLIWEAVAPGTVRISAGGTAVCAADSPCPLFVRLFAVTIVIS